MDEDFLSSPPWVDEDSPDRCQHAEPTKQCRFRRLDGQKFCKYHVAIYNRDYRKTTKLKKYRLLQHHMRVDEFVCNPELKNLSEEIGILNFTLETLLNQCHTPWDLQVNQNKIESLVDKIARTTQINLKIQKQIGRVLDEDTLAGLVDNIAKAILEEDLTEEQITRISTKIGSAISRAKEIGANAAMTELLK